MAWGASSSSAETLGKYQLVGKLARGGQAEVFLAVLQGAHDVNKLVVVKRMRTGRDANENFSDVDNVAMFLDEARLAARLHHPNVIHTYEVGEQKDGTPFIVMEYLDGVPLSKLVRHKEGRTRISPLFWAVFGSEVLSGLAYAHDLTDYDGSPLGIVHRDVSPQNVIVTYDGDVKLVDFGIAKAALNVSVTATGVFKGKVRYMAPEQLRGGCDQRADLFSLGVVLWEALAGRRLFEGDDVQVIRALIQDPIPSILDERPDIDAELAAIIDKSLAKETDARWQTAQEMREALDTYLGQRRPKKLEVATLVRDLFKELREEVQRQLATAMAQLRPSRASTSIPLVATERTSGSTRVMTASSGERAPSAPLAVILPTILQPSTPSETPIASALRTMPPITMPPKPRAFWPMLGAGAIAMGIVCAIGIGVLVVGRSKPVEATSTTTAASVAPAYVQIDSDPPGAHVALDDHALGKTPLRAEALGNHASFLLTQDGYEPARLEVDLVPGQTRSESVKLTALPQPGPITTTEKPSPAPPVSKRPPPANTKRPARAPTTASPIAQPAAPSPSALPLPDRPSIKALDDDPKRNIKVLD
jgi:eukaryotic-like serine/threonine-protein kinase